MIVRFEKGDRKEAKALNQGIIVFFRYNTDGTSFTFEGIYEQRLIDELTKTVYKFIRENQDGKKLCDVRP
jgi:hypothetical protein